MGTDAKPLPFEQSIAGAAITASIGKSANDESPLPADETNLLAGAKTYMQATHWVVICQSFTRSAVLLHGLFSATCDTDLLSSSCAFTFCRSVVSSATCFFSS